MSLEALGRQLGIVVGPREAPLLVNVGLLFFNEHPERFFPATQIDVVWFPEGAGGDVFTEKVFKGPLARMSREALEYIRRNYIMETVIKHRDRAEATRIENFPYSAIEEALVNAIYHRSYEEREPIEVRISPKELVVVSYPGPDRSVRLSDLRKGTAIPRRYRSRRIGELLKELDLTEGRATGIPKILRAMKANGSPSARFEFDEDYSYFITRLPVHPGAARAEPPRDPTPTPQVTPPVTPQVGRLLDRLAGEMTRSEIMSVMGLKDRMHFAREYLERALEAGVIEMTIPDKPNSRLQRYRITEAGRAWLVTQLP
jgi:ATP-dependent DNA helicase RecG